MSEVYFDPILIGESNNPDTVNSRLSDLDAAIYGIGVSAQNGIDTVQDALDALVLDDGTGNAEVIAARTRIVYPGGTPPAVLGDTIEYVGRGVANVLAFGADDTGVASSSAAVQAALAAASIVYFPPGTYKFNTTVTTGSDKTITGSGATLKVGSATPLSVTGNRVIIDGLRFMGTATDHTSGSADVGGECLYINATANREDIIVRNCQFSWASRAIWFVSPDPVDTTITIRNFSVTGCTFRDLRENGIAWRKSGATRGTNYVVNDVRITNCHFEDSWFFPDEYMPQIYVGGGVTIHRIAITGCTAKNIMTAFVGGTQAGNVEEMTISGCHVSGERTFVGGEANVDKIKTQMGLDLSGIKNLTVTGCSFDFIREECIALYTITQFAITGCTFRRGNYGISTNHDDSATAGVGSRGVISGCTFTDMVDQSGTNVNKTAIQIADANSGAAPAHISIAGCRFDAGSLGMSFGIIIESLAHPDVQVSGCSFNGMARGIYMFDAPTNRIIVQGCRFESCSVHAIHSAGNLMNSVIANCIFESNVIDISANTNTYLRCTGNTHNNTTNTALFLQNATMLTVVNSLFSDVAAVHGGTNRVGNPTNMVIWLNNIYAGTTPLPASSNGYIQINQQGQRSFLTGTTPAAGTWLTGDVAWDNTPSPSGQIGWVCTAGGTPGTWKAFGTIAP